MSETKIRLRVEALDEEARQRGYATVPALAAALGVSVSQLYKVRRAARHGLGSTAASPPGAEFVAAVLVTFGGPPERWFAGGWVDALVRAERVSA